VVHRCHDANQDNQRKGGGREEKKKVRKIFENQNRLQNSKEIRTTKDQQDFLDTEAEPLVITANFKTHIFPACLSCLSRRSVSAVLYASQSLSLLPSWLFLYPIFTLLACEYIYPHMCTYIPTGLPAHKQSSEHIYLCNNRRWLSDHYFRNEGE